MRKITKSTSVVGVPGLGVEEFLRRNNIPFGWENNGSADIRPDRLVIDEAPAIVAERLYLVPGNPWAPARLEFIGCAGDEVSPERHQYQVVDCPVCGLPFCWACSGKGTNVHEGGKYQDDVLECPLCGHNCAEER